MSRSAPRSARRTGKSPRCRRRVCHDAAGRVTGRRQVVDRDQGELDALLEALGGARLGRDPREPIAEDLLGGGGRGGVRGADGVRAFRQRVQPYRRGRLPAANTLVEDRQEPCFQTTDVIEVTVAEKDVTDAGRIEAGRE